MGNTAGNTLGNTVGDTVSDTVGDKVPKFLEPCAYMPAEGEVVIPPRASRPNSGLL